ncbi:alpha amylase C-terminal domain-containing protein [Labilibaculum sp. DW002]|uniref:1,4-alpha-glucan branching enzyme n=1 Tax=Paralabilibaculum antarcticum TaxID=2912572 RepID=A0ABT5VXS2_9BACT|nr:alpha amylase C-terminal domain-containing protein [Labilibaculum sp. DW002]MDE5420060.1 alpha amylase C-terminal domain-containing protein [Labilibaculum sp. DW002]
MIKPLKIIQSDPLLEEFQFVIQQRIDATSKKEKELCDSSLSNFANGHHYYGIHRTDQNWIIREWAPNASEMYLIGDFSEWKENPKYQFTKDDNGNFELVLDLDQLDHKDLYKLILHWSDGSGERIPVWSNRVIQDSDTLLYSAQVWYPNETFDWQHEKKRQKYNSPLIYEAHVGMATEKEGVGTYNEFREFVLPRIHKAGYNTIQLMAIQEHPYYGSFGYHVSSLFAASSRFGTPEDLKGLIDEAHSLGIMVIMDIVHSHAVKNELEGIGNFDGSPHQFFHADERREHAAWDSLCYNYAKNEVLHLLLSNIKYWLEEYHFDGYRFDGVTSMLYYDHGLSRDFTSYKMYFDAEQDEDAICYLTLANKLIHEYNPNAISVAEEMSGYPGLASPLDDGGLDFDYRLAMGIPDYWIKLIKEQRDENWKVGNIFYELSNKRAEEKTISYAESHDQALVGDQTLIFRLLDKAMYDSMDKSSENLIVDRGIALHKIIRLLTLSCAGNGYLNFMGNEFGHPEWIDFPREGNNWSYKHARRQWSLLDNTSLRFENLNEFDRDMIALQNESNFMQASNIKCLQADEDNQVLAIQRNDLLFVFNLNPSKSLTYYGIPATPGKYQMVLNSDHPKYGGFDRINENILYRSKPEAAMARNHRVYLYLPSRTALVFKHIPSKPIF